METLNAPTKFGPRLANAWNCFDAENARDPNREIIDGIPQPRELVYAGWLTHWVGELCAEPSEALWLAARCQHLCRWSVPRETYPPTRAGYLKWREDLKKFHASKAAEILERVGYDAETIARVRSLNLKELFPQDAESRVLEDALCLVFLERQFKALAEKTTEEKVINALRKSWNKMTAAAQSRALGLRYEPRERELLERALPPAK